MKKKQQYNIIKQSLDGKLNIGNALRKFISLTTDGVHKISKFKIEKQEEHSRYKNDFLAAS